MQHPRLTIAAIAVAIAAIIAGFTIASASGSSSSSPASSSAGGPKTTTGDPAGTATVHTATATVQGTTETILVDEHGLPLYLYEPDTTTTSHVTGQLASLWPPLVSAAPTGTGVTGQLSTVKTSNGEQVAYNGHFLYTFVQDSPGHVTGQGVQDFYVATPSLARGDSEPETADPSDSGSGDSDDNGY
jgi:predicted lipoprotein with Yx(FWY)xxD motif